MKAPVSETKLHVKKEKKIKKQKHFQVKVHTTKKPNKPQTQTTQSIHGQTEEQHAIETIMKEFHSDQQVNDENENEVNTEPHVQMIDRGDEDDGVRIIEIDELIQSRVESLNVPDMLPEEENDPQITGLFHTRLKIRGMSSNSTANSL